MKLPAGIAALLCAALALTGCSHYQLGHGGDVSFGTVFVAPVHSDVSLPQAQAILTSAVREAFSRDGRVQLAGEAGSADAVLALTVIEYRRDTTVARADDTGLARRFDLVLRARATLTNRKTGQALFTDRVLEAKRGAFTDSGQLQSEYQALPLLADDLAQAALRASLETW